MTEDEMVGCKSYTPKPRQCQQKGGKSAPSLCSRGGERGTLNSRSLPRSHIPAAEESIFPGDRGRPGTALPPTAAGSGPAAPASRQARRVVEPEPNQGFRI